MNAELGASLLAFLLAFAIGSLSLGGRLIRRWSGVDPQDVSAHNLGVENTLRFVGTEVAVTAFVIDVLKGILAMGLAWGHPWAGLGVLLGHLYPLPLLQGGDRPRGRGNAVILGVLCGLQVFAGMPAWLVGAPVVVYAALLGVTGYVALATLGGLLTFALLVGTMLGFSAIGIVAWLMLGVALWRHKASLARILDGTEARLGEPPSVRGLDPSVVLAAFMVHPLTLSDLWQPRSQKWLQHFAERQVLPEALLRKALLLMRPQKQGEISGIYLKDGRELRVMLISAPMLPDQIHSHPGIATRMAIQGARLAREMGAEAFGLGAFWSTVGRKGLDVQRAVPDVAITNGGAYTAATVKAAVPGLLKAFAREGGSLRQATAAVVGANGVVAFGVARMIADSVSDLILIGRDRERLERSAKTLRRKFPHTNIVTACAISAVVVADLVFTATSDPEPVLFAEHIKPGAWVFDLGRPADVDASVRSVPGVHIVPGGVVRPPGAMRSRIDFHFGDGLIPACMAETMIMTATRAFQRASLGPITKSSNIHFYLTEGARLGFEIITRDDHVARLEGVW